MTTRQHIYALRGTRCVCTCLVIINISLPLYNILEKIALEQCRAKVKKTINSFLYCYCHSICFKTFNDRIEITQMPFLNLVIDYFLSSKGNCNFLGILFYP